MGTERWGTLTELQRERIRQAVGGVSPSDGLRAECTNAPETRLEVVTTVGGAEATTAWVECHPYPNGLLDAVVALVVELEPPAPT
ncbi:MAG: hypothetical protein Q8P18_21610 [Pseudomonadota bacterium]|nr:hypothetical protein [Pseudomonadota bacterium]